MAHGVPLTALRGQSYRNTREGKNNDKTKTNEHGRLISIQKWPFIKYHNYTLAFFTLQSSQEFSTSFGESLF